jgi:L-threonylcarbamoyladenylate synthase
MSFRIWRGGIELFGEGFVAELFHLEGPDQTALDVAKEALEGGAVVVLPTDTVYGIAARPDIVGATDRIFEVKRRSRDLNLPVLVAGSDEAARVAVFDPRARVLAERFWPGGLTIVLPRSGWANDWDLGEDRETLAVRVPDHPVALALLMRVGPLAVTSANRSGVATPRTCQGVESALGDAVAVYLCAGPAPGDTPSTVIDLTASEARILREGAIPSEAVFGALEESS